MTNVVLAERLGISEAAVRRLVNPDHQSRLDGVAVTLQCLGRQLVLDDRVTVVPEEFRVVDPRFIGDVLYEWTRYPVVVCIGRRKHCRACSALSL